MARVLIVDDEPATVGFLVDRLEAGGHNVTTLTSESQFNSLSASEIAAYHLLVLDIKVGFIRRSADEVIPSGQSAGVRMARRVRVDFRIPRRQVRIVAYSVVARAEVMNAVRSLNCEYVVKGSSGGQAIIDVVDRMLRHAK